MMPRTLAAGGDDGVGDDAHEADLAAAVDEADAGAGEAAAEVGGGGAVGGAVAVAGAAEDGDGEAVTEAGHR